MVTAAPHQSGSTSPSTSYKPSLHDDDDDTNAITLVNPCHGAPPDSAELRPFSSRQSNSPVQLTRTGTFAPIDEDEKSAWPQDEEAGSSGGGDASAPVLSKPKMILIASGMLLTYFLGTASSASVTLMIPEIARSLEISELSAQWVVSAYSLAYGCGLLFAGRMSDLFGRKMLYLGGLCTFCIFSIISAVVKNRIGLCILRAICGLGLAVASPAGFGIVGVCFRNEPARTIAFAAFGLGAPLGAACGTPIAGAIAATGSKGWTYLFYLLGGIAVIPIAIGILVIPKDKPVDKATQDRRIDWIGGLIVTAGLCLFCFSLTESGIATNGWATPYVPALLVVSIILLVVFGFWERHLERNTTFPPIAKFSLFTRHNYKVTVVVVSTFFIVMSVYGYVYLATIWYQTYMGMTALESAVRILPCMISGALAAGSVMWLGPRFKAPTLILLGCALSSIACLFFAVEPRGTTYWAFQFVSLILIPWGIDFMVCLGNVMVSNLVEEDEQSVGGAIFQTSIQIGASIGTCLSSLVSTTRAEATGDLLRGLKDGFWMMTAFAWFVLIVIFIGLRKVGLAKDVAQPSSSSGKKQPAMAH